MSFMLPLRHNTGPVHKPLYIALSSYAPFLMWHPAPALRQVLENFVPTVCLVKQSQNFESRPKEESAMKINEAITLCRECGQTGGSLIAYAQSLVSQNMTYSYTNSFDLPHKAFEKGRGYCWQQASILNELLKNCGFKSRMVYCTKNSFPPKVYDGVTLPQTVSGHVWCRVFCDGQEGDVCPGNPNNRFGSIHFKPLAPVKNWNAFVCFFSYWGSAALNHARFCKIQEQKGKVTNKATL